MGVHVTCMIAWLIFSIPMLLAWNNWLREWYRSAIPLRLLNVAIVVVSAGYLPADIVGQSPQWQKVVVLLNLIWLSLFLCQCGFVMHRQRLLEFQSDRVCKLLSELAARDQTQSNLNHRD